MRLATSNKLKIIESENFNMVFNKEDGTTVTWGKTLEDNPDMCPFGATLVDIEVTTICAKACPWCYKSNTNKGSNMSFKTFKKIIDTLPSTVTQVALGADYNLKTNPELFNMMWYCRDKGIIPNITLAECDYETAAKLSKVCGAVAVSYYGEWDKFIATISHLNDAMYIEDDTTLKQINIHQLVAKETTLNILDLANRFEEELENKINAIVLLSLKQRGRGKFFNSVSYEEFKNIISIFNDKEIPYGFDSCSACKVNKSLLDLYGKSPLENIESCESTLYSCYFNAEGKFYPCSFNEEEEYAIHIDEVNNFLNDLWFNEKTIKFRNKLLATKNEYGLCSCPSYVV